MGDSLITIIAIFLAAILMFVFPLMSLSERTDDISQLAVATATNEFVDKIRTTGKITLDDYEKYIQTISSTGNSFEVEMQIQQLDENPGVKVTQAEMTKIGENVYYNKYTSQIEKQPKQKETGNKKTKTELETIQKKSKEISTSRKEIQGMLKKYQEIFGEQIKEAQSETSKGELSEKEFENAIQKMNLSQAEKAKKIQKSV